MPRTPEELRELVERYLAELVLTPELGTLAEPMRHALGGKRVRPVLSLAAAEAVGADVERRASGGGGRRARALVLARPRRPARARRRRGAPWAAERLGRLRRGDRNPGGRCAPRRGLPARAFVSGAGGRARARRRDARDDRRPAARPRGRPRSRPAPCAEDRGAVLGVGDVRTLGGRAAGVGARAVAGVRRRARPALPDRRRHPRRRRLRPRGRIGARRVASPTRRGNGRRRGSRRFLPRHRC